MNDFCEIIREISKYTINKVGDRYCGNASLRCSGSFLMTKSNIPKDNIQLTDFVVSTSKLCSIDAPIHTEIYKQFPNINYIIHGHSKLSMVIDDMELLSMTENEYEHGDVRVVDEIIKPSKHTVDSGDSSFFMVNIRKHGFVIGSNNTNIIKLMIDGQLVTFNEIE